MAMEEFVARHTDGRDCFFMWQVEPSVIFGRNQLMENEVNLDYCRRHGIQVYRRKSGGGCVYADMSNVMFSYITSDEAVGFTFNRYINMVVHMLRKLGAEACASGRNDVLIDRRKVSGSAFYRIPGRSIVHGTMLYDTDMANMTGAITPSDTKLTARGIKSVRQRVALLKDYTDVTLADFMAFARAELCDETVALGPGDVARIAEMEKEYLSTDFIMGKNPKYTLSRRKRIEGVGEVEARVELKNGVIRSVTLSGDFFSCGAGDSGVLRRLCGVPLEREAVASVLPARLDDIARNLSGAALAELLTEK